MDLFLLMLNLWAKFFTEKEGRPTWDVKRRARHKLLRAASHFEAAFLKKWKKHPVNLKPRVCISGCSLEKKKKKTNGEGGKKPTPQ